MDPRLLPTSTEQGSFSSTPSFCLVLITIIISAMLRALNRHVTMACTKKAYLYHLGGREEG